MCMWLVVQFGPAVDSIIRILCAYICEVLHVRCNIGFIVAFKMCPLLQIMTGSALQRRVAGKGVTLSAIHPGIVS